MTDSTPAHRCSVRQAAVWALIFVSLAAMFYPGLGQHMLAACDPHTFNDDTRAFIWPLLTYSPHHLFKGDTALTYTDAVELVLQANASALIVTLDMLD